MNLDINATVSGSFRRGMSEVQTAVYALTDAGVRVLSPADPRVVGQFGEFLFVASDRQRSIRLIQDRHFDSIRHSDFLWLVAPGGYVGASAAMEIGYAVRADVPVYTDTPPNDLTFRQYVNVVANISKAVELIVRGKPYACQQSNVPLLVDPTTAVAHAHEKLDVVHKTLTSRSVTEDLPEFKDSLRDLREILRLCVPIGRPSDSLQSSDNYAHCETTRSRTHCQGL